MHTRRVLIFGAEGMVGQEFARACADEPGFAVFPRSRKAADVTDAAAVHRALARVRPEVVINCAAMISVDACQANPLGAWMTNAIGPGAIVSAMAQLGMARALFVHMSTSDVFSGAPGRRFAPADPPSPVNTYGWSKRGGEMIVASEAAAGNIRALILRTSWMYAERRETFVDLVARSLLRTKPLAVAGDQYNTPVSVRDVVRAALRLMRQPRARGIYHLASAERRPVSRYDVARFIAGVLGCDPGLLRKRSREDIFKTARPRNSMLAPSPGLILPPWRTSLAAFLRARYPDRGRSEGEQP